jgi:parallel beta-helix repeat protein
MKRISPLPLGRRVIRLSASLALLLLIPPVAVCAEDAGRVLIVAADGSGTYVSIQAAIDAAPQRAVIRIAPGVYEENLAIRKPLTLEAKDWQQTAIRAKLLWNGSETELTQLFQQRLEEAGPNADRKAIGAKLQEELFPPALTVEGTRDVEIRGLRFTNSRSVGKQRLPQETLFRFKNAQAKIRDCAIVGSPGNGIEIFDGSRVEIDNCLVAAVWHTGIVIGRREGGTLNVVVRNCDVRNCYYAGIVIGRGNDDVLIERCRVSGAAWHGIRYDDASPKIVGNLIFRNARCGIYASGKTSALVQNNLFYRNEMNGISCWFNNRDTIENNTFADNLREGLAVLGASEPVIRNNIFSGNPTAVYQGKINSRQPSAQTLGALRLQGNLFWNNQKNLVRPTETGDSTQAQPQTLALGAETKSLEQDPKFNNPQGQDFSFAPGSIALEQHLGATDLLSFQSPWPLQGEEKAIIPDEDTRDYSKWKGKDK